MEGLDEKVSCHKLNVMPSAILVKQATRMYKHELDLKIKEEVQRLLAAGFIKSIQHPLWLSSIVTVGKIDKNQIRICVDFRDLNRAYPKDEFPLPSIDSLIDATAGHEMYSFMDGYVGYNQIKMDPTNAEKTVFRTPLGNFMYIVIPFGLKNAGATYQRR